MRSRHARITQVAYIVALAGPMAVCVAYGYRQGHLVPREAERGASRDAAAAELLAALDDPGAPPSGDPVVPFADPPPASPVAAGSAALRNGPTIALRHVDQLVVSTEVPASWGAGPVLGRPGELEASRRVFPEDQLYARRIATGDTLPPEHAGLVGTRIDMYGAKGKLCEVRVTELWVVAEVNGDGYELVDELELDDEGQMDRAELPGLRRRVYAAADRRLMARLEGIDARECEGAIFGRASDLPAPRLLVATEQRPPKQALRDFRRSAAEALIPRFDEYRAQPWGEAPPWASWSELARATYTHQVYADGAGQPRAVYQRVGDVESTCGDGFGEYRAEIAPLGAASGPAREVWLSTPPLVFVDADGDGRFELISAEHALYDAEGNYLHEAAPPWQGCPC